jgi:hypothetical protein
VSLALLESTALFAAVCGTIFVWGHPLLSDWLDVAAAPGQAAGLSLCCIAGVALILVAGFYGLFPDTRIAEGPFLSSVLVMSGLLPLRAVGHGIMRRRAFVDRALVVGTGPRARKLVGEIRGA